MNGGEIGGKHSGKEEKRIKLTGIDPFGELPVSLLINILSFLKVKEAAITSVLSKRWESLWAELPRLEFVADMPKLDTGTGEIDKVREFVSWVNRTLAVRTGNCLEKFEVVFLYHTVFSCDVDAWLHFATENKVKDLILETYRFDGLYTPPQVIYSCPSLTSLRLACCIMDSKTAISWHSLTKLNLFEVTVDQVLLDKILSSCPVLYYLSLITCRGFDLVEVNSPSVARISLGEYEDATRQLKVSAPHVRRLDIRMLPRTVAIEPGNISSLDRADIDFVGVPRDVEVVIGGAMDILQSVHQAKELYVGWQFVRVLSSMSMFWQLPQSRRELLKVAFKDTYDRSISGIIGLLDSSPNLETLVLEGTATTRDVILETTARDDLDRNLLHLKTIKVRNFADSKGEPLLTLARVLLTRAPALEEMVITSDVKDLSCKMVNTILKYPRSSCKAVVHHAEW